MFDHESMVERVARSMCAIVLDGVVEPRDSEWDALPASSKELFRKRARFSIEAMREPTKAMMLAGAQEVFDNPDNADRVARETFRAMIEEALKP